MSAPLKTRHWRFTPARTVMAALLVLAAGACFLYPAAVLVRAMFDPALNGPGIPAVARTLHESLAPRYAAWATAALASENPTHVSIANVSGTEWPVFGSMFYLRAEEALQDAWERDHSLFAQEPRVCARPAIEAATRVVISPKFADWVRRYWGEDYLRRENVFYRMLVVSTLVSHHRLTGSDEFLPMLRTQVETLCEELAASPTGLLDDYPRQCYPSDVLEWWEAVHRADAVLGTDHRQLIEQGRRGFAGDRLTASGLPPFAASSRTGQPYDNARGSSSSAMCGFAAPIWPDLATQWYGIYEQKFWQSDWLAAGFREFQRGEKFPEWGFDVDAGPVIRGNGFSACAFGIAAARALGRYDHAYPLSMQALALSWPLPGGRLLVPRLVSDSEHAPLIGEACILYQLTKPAYTGTPRYHSGALPAVPFVALAVYLLPGWLLLFIAWRILRPQVRPKAL